jgi:hypothetical protein
LRSHIYPLRGDEENSQRKKKDEIREDKKIKVPEREREISKKGLQERKDHQDQEKTEYTFMCKGREHIPVVLNWDGSKLITEVDTKNYPESVRRAVCSGRSPR